MKIHVIGLQRSGTNFLSNLLQQGFGEAVTQSGDRSVFWKHSLPTEIDVSKIESTDLQLILVTKHPYHWLSSITSESRHDLFARRFGSQRPTLKSLIGFYQAFHAEWLTQLSPPSRIMHFRFEDCLASSEFAVRAVGEKISRVPDLPIVFPSRVPYSPRFSARARQRYLSGKSNLDRSSRLIAKNLLDLELLEGLGYLPTPPVFKNTLRWKPR